MVICCRHSADIRVQWGPSERGEACGVLRARGGQDHEPPEQGTLRGWVWGREDRWSQRLFCQVDSGQDGA